MLRVGWSHAAVEDWPPRVQFPAGWALSDPEWSRPGAEVTRGRRDVAGCQIKGMRIWTRGNPGAGIGTEAARWSRDGYYVQILNEPNLNVLPSADVEGFRGGPEEHARYILDAIYVAGAGHGIAFTPMSPGVGLNVLHAWLTGTLVDEAIAACAVVLAHCYGTAGEMWAALQPVLEVARRHGKRVIVSECSIAAGGDVDLWSHELELFLAHVEREAPEVDAVCVFAPKWPSPDPGFKPLMMLGTAVEQVMARWTARPVVQPTPVQEKRMGLSGRGLWIWNLGDTDASIAKLKRARCDWVAIKAGDGPARWDRQWNQATIDRFRAAGLRVLAWTYNYGGFTPGSAHGATRWTIEDEIDVAERAIALDCDGLIADVEAEWRDKPDAPATAQYFCERIRAACGDRIFAYAPLPVVAYHTALPYAQFNQVVDLAMPQFYVRALEMTPDELLAQWREWEAKWRSWGLRVPELAPIGDAYDKATPDDIRAMESAWPVETWSYWSLDAAGDGLLDAMAAASGAPLDQPAPVEPAQPTPITAACDAVWDALLALEATDPTRSRRAQAAFGDVIKPALPAA